MKLIMETWRSFVKEQYESDPAVGPNFDIKTGEPLTEKGMEICAASKDCWHKHLFEKIYRQSSSPSEYQNLVDIAKAAAEKDGWYADGAGPWDYEWKDGKKMGRKMEPDAPIEKAEKVDPDDNNDGEVSPKALRRIADKVDQNVGSPPSAPASDDKTEKLARLSQISKDLKSGKIDDLQALAQIRALKGKS